MQHRVTNHDVQVNIKLTGKVVLDSNFTAAHKYYINRVSFSQDYVLAALLSYKFLAQSNPIYVVLM